MTKQSQNEANTTALCILGQSDVQLWGMSPAERLTRGFKRAGISNIISEADLVNTTGSIILVRGDIVLDEPLVSHITTTENLVILSEEADGSEPLVAHVSANHSARVAKALHNKTTQELPDINICAPADLDASYWKALRKRETPYALPITQQNSSAVLWRVFMGTYKGATDFVTKHLWPRPAYHTTRIIAPWGITPNIVTTISAVMVILAFYLFMEGSYAWGLAAAWMMTFLDTVDGKLARVTLTSSPWGNVFDHGIDLIHPPFWYWAWGAGLAIAGTPLTTNTLYWLFAIIIGGYVLQRVIEGLAIATLGIEIHIWRPIDTLFRQFTARRNPNLALLTLSIFIGRPDYGLIAVAAWTAICLLLHGLQLAQAWNAKRKLGKLTSWLTDPPDAS